MLGRNHGAVVQQSDRRIWLGHALGAGDGGGNVSDDLFVSLAGAQLPSAGGKTQRQ